MEGGHVQLNGERIKASRHVKVGDRLRINRERELFEIDVTGIPGGGDRVPRPGCITGKRRKARPRARTFASSTDYPGRCRPVVPTSANDATCCV